MGSRREEERNEKIIRGLMKLPPNRMCINCNSLGPQYVCTNFWTFICMTCSGIHREFTHRVKSVSMSKFTSQEVESLQNGGNQRAREIYLKDWDMQTQRLPSSSNVEKIREFIKNVYVDRRYAGGKCSNKPPRDMQGLKSHEDDTRRASSYHSYSQSPPYDHQYEDRRYGRQVGALSRKPGSDRGHHIARFSSFIGSPGRFSDQAFEDRFANEGSAPRASDYSVSSAGDPFRSGRESPSFQKESGFSSPTLQPSREVLTEDTRHQETNSFADSNLKRNAQGVPHIQRTASSTSTGLFDGKSTSFKSYDTSKMDVRSEPHQTAEVRQDNKSTFQQLSVSMNYGSLDLFSAPNFSATPPTDLFDMPAPSSVPTTEEFQPATVQTSSRQLPRAAPSIDLFSTIVEHSPTSNMDVKTPELPVPKNEAWATFDAPQPAAANPGLENHYLAEVPRDGEFSLHFDQSSTLNTSVPWPLFEGSVRPASSIPSPWQGGLLNVQAPTVATNTQSWNAFEDFNGHISQEGVKQNHSNVIEAQAYNPLVAADPIPVIGVSQDNKNYGIQGAVNHPGCFSSAPSEFGTTVFAPPSTFPLMGENQSHASDHKSINPFDLPFDSDMEQSNMFFDMGSLQAALPNSESSSTFIAGVSEPWFPQNPVTPFIQAAPQGGLPYVAGQSQSSQLPNTTPAQEHVASIGGNPFA